MNTLLMILALFLGNEDVSKTHNYVKVFSDNYVKVAKDLWYPESRATKENLKKLDKIVIYYIIERTSIEPDEGKLRRINLVDPKKSQEIKDKEIFEYWKKHNKPPKDWFNYVRLKQSEQSS